MNSVTIDIAFPYGELMLPAMLVVALVTVGFTMYLVKRSDAKK